MMMDLDPLFDPFTHRDFEDDPYQGKSQKAIKRLKRRQESKNMRHGQAAKPFRPKNETQKELFDALAESLQVFAIGGAGTGKTYVSARHAIRRLQNNEVDRLVVCRPTVSAPQHRQGFLPGGIRQKQGPWLVPIFDAFKDEISTAVLDQLIQSGKVEILPFEFMRGRSIPNAVVILDEAQNCTLADLRLFLTRIGEGTQVIVSGDVDQVDLPLGQSGLAHVIDMIEDHDIDADIVEFGPEDVVRSEVAKQWVKAFSSRQEKENLNHPL